MVSFDNSPIQYYHHGRFRVAGGVLPDAVTAYQTFGDITKPCIIFPTCYGGRLDDQKYMIGEAKALQPSKYFIVTFALFCNGESSSPSNTPSPYNGPYFPAISYEDNIRAQLVVLTKALWIEKAYAVIGYSMGGQQAYYWPVMYPDYVERFIVICGSARTSPHNKCFLEGPKAALTASKDFDNGHYKSVPQFGVRAFGRVYSAWAYSQTWYRNHEYLYNGTYPDLNSFIREGWESGFLSGWDANDLIALINTWSAGDVSRVRDGGDFEACLSSIKARSLVMPSKSDLFFSPEDNEIELSHLKNAKLVVIDSIWGHMAGGGSNTRDDDFIKKEVRAFLES
ncbi:hypothetical protein M0805_005801 [Coniferiporia weirii]|nr:hypothetical protein M0805_005801 [Coniferiporia weirii]